MTNYERIKNMRIEEMAEFIHFVNEKNCGEHCKNAKCGAFGRHCEIGIKQWLNSEVDENDG